MPLLHLEDDRPVAFCRQCWRTHELGACLSQYDSLRDPLLRRHIISRRGFLLKKGLIDDEGRPTPETTFHQKIRERERLKTAEERRSAEQFKSCIEREQQRKQILSKQEDQMQIQRQAEKIRQWRRSRSTTMISITSPEQIRSATLSRAETTERPSTTKSAYLSMHGQQEEPMVEFKYSGQDRGTLAVYQRVGAANDRLILKSTIANEGTFSVKLSDIPCDGRSTVLSFYINGDIKGALRFCCLAGKTKWYIDKQAFTVTGHPPVGKPCYLCSS